MGKPRKIDSSEAIGGRNTETARRGRRGTKKVYRTDTRGPNINEIHRHIRRRLQRSVGGRYRGPISHFVDTIMEP